MRFSALSPSLYAATACSLISTALFGASEPPCDTNETYKLATPADIAPGDLFGLDVGFAGTALCVAAPAHDQTGAVYVFRFNPCAMVWSLETKLTASDGAPGDRFGDILSASGPIVAVGAWLDDDNGSDSGSAYVFRYDGFAWTEEQKLLAGDGEAGDAFGLTITAQGDTVIVSAANEDEQGENAGAAYVFNYDGNTWTENAKLTASDAQPGDCFGYPVAVSDDVLLVGAPYDDDNGNLSGSAYVFRFNGASWVEEAKLIASDGEAGDLFALWAAIDGDVIVVGAPNEDEGGENAGAAYVFRYDGAGWTQEAKLIASDVAAGDQFGGVVAVENELILVTSWRHDGAETDSGAVYVYEYDGLTWNEVAKFTASDAGAEYVFGSSAVIDNGLVAVGSKWHDGAGEDAGAAYVVVGLDDCNDNGVLDVCDIADGASADINGNGIPDECEGRNCAGDLDGDGDVDTSDLLALLGAWGACP